MKRIKPFVFLTALVGIWLLGSSDIAYNRYGSYEPYFMERAELERSVSYAGEAREMADPGKLWIDGDVIYVVERYKGVHVIDNSTPETPAVKDFIVAPGCMDVAVKEGTMYLDNAVDLVAFDLSSGEVTERIKDFFPEPASPEGYTYGYHSSEMILVGWKLTTDPE